MSTGTGRGSRPAADAALAPAVETLPRDMVPRSRVRRRARGLAISREIGLLALIAITIVVCSILYPETFPTAANFNAVLRNLALDGILAIGMMVMLVSGVFDLSIGGMASMSGVVTGYLMKDSGLPVPAAIAGDWRSRWLAAG